MKSVLPKSKHTHIHVHMPYINAYLTMALLEVGGEMSSNQIINE